jgi:hypothetical protein
LALTRVFATRSTFWRLDHGVASLFTSLISIDSDVKNPIIISAIARRDSKGFVKNYRSRPVLKTCRNISFAGWSYRLYGADESESDTGAIRRNP